MATEYAGLSGAMQDARETLSDLSKNCQRAFAAALWNEFKGNMEKAEDFLQKALDYEAKGDE